MSNEDFLKAAAARAQVGSSADVAQKAKKEMILLRRKFAYELRMSGKTYREIGNVLGVSKNRALIIVGIYERWLRRMQRERAEIVDGNP